MWEIVANIVEMVANWGAGAASTVFTYEPELPEELRK